jgi:branched-chain amino acid transport system substrate-binding protein
VPEAAPWSVGGVVSVCSGSRRSGSRSWVGVACLAVLLAPACGSRLSTEEVRAQNTLPGTTGAVAAGETRSAGAAGVVDAVPGGATVSPGATPSASPGATVAAGPSSSGGGPTGAAASGPKAPIVIGYIGWLSGTGGETMSPTRDVWVAWARTVNAGGGINGHPVQVLVGDHGGNESRAFSIARDFVENKGAIALTHAAGGPAIGAYAKSKSIPVIGSILTGGEWNTNPMMFPPFGANEANSFGIARAMKRAGVSKAAMIYCAEAADCEDGSKRFRRHAEAEGIEVVSEIRYSVTAPDYTAECLQMQRSGAQAVYPGGDTSSMIRMAKACARQGFRPKWVSPTMDDSVAGLPEFDAAISVGPVFPWFLRTGSPALQEYGKALQTYAPGRLTKGNTFMSWAWVSAKLLEKAAQKVSATPTSQDILNGLWAMRGETLGGLTPPRTFQRNQPTPETYCYYEGQLRGGRWGAPQGLTPICR